MSRPMGSVSCSCHIVRSPDLPRKSDMTPVVRVVEEKPAHVKVDCGARSRPSVAGDALQPRKTIGTLAGGSLRSACSSSQM